MKDKKITVLGQDYKLVFNTPDDDPKLKEWNGYHEPYSKKIVIDSTIVEEANKDALGTENTEVYFRHVYRHEVMHAFFCESGITYRYSKDEEDFLVDWIARMYPKMKKIFEELGVED
jgi:hypothetical protein